MIEDEELPLAEPMKGDRVQFKWQGAYATGTVMRVRKDGTRVVKPDSQDVNEGAWVDRMAVWKVRSVRVEAPRLRFEDLETVSETDRAKLENAGFRPVLRWESDRLIRDNGKGCNLTTDEALLYLEC